MSDDTKTRLIRLSNIIFAVQAVGAVIGLGMMAVGLFWKCEDMIFAGFFLQFPFALTMLKKERNNYERQRSTKTQRQNHNQEVENNAQIIRRTTSERDTEAMGT